MKTSYRTFSLSVTAALLGLAALPAQSQTSAAALLPDPAWDCGMPDGIPSPESGRIAFTIEVPLERATGIGRTQYGQRRVAVGLEGSVTGPKLSAVVTQGALDFELELQNGTIEIEQLLVLQAPDGSFIFARNAGTGVSAKDVRVVMDFEAPDASDYAWLNTGRFVARRELNAAGKTLRLSVYDVTDVAVSPANAIRVSKPAGVPAQPWDYRSKAPSEQQGAELIHENVTLGPGQSVGPSKHGNRNIIPITGGTISGRITGKVLMGGADYQNLSPPATIDAHYLWQADDGEIIIVRNGGAFGSLVPTFETRVDGPYAFLNDGKYLSSNPGMGQGGVSLTFYESKN